jgi:hypothetical protein
MKYYNQFLEASAARAEKSPNIDLEIKSDFAPGQAILFRPSIEFALWRIDGQESEDSGGGPVTLFVLTDGWDVLPDAYAAIEKASGNKSSWNMINSIVRAYRSEDGRSHEGWAYIQVVNQTGHNMEPAAANAIGNLLIGEVESN